VARYHGDRPWSLQTGKGIFSTPIIDGEGVVYVGSADHVFYAVGPNGTERWRFQTEEIIDSAGALLAAGVAAAGPAVVFPSGDGRLRAVSADDGALIWSFDARESGRSSYNCWFEANVAVGYDGRLYAGNTNFNYYAITPQGELKWVYPTRSNNWSNAALGADGTLYWGSNDTWVRAVGPDGIEKWRKRTLGFISASAAIGSDSTVYIGSFDSLLYALDPLTGKTRWRFRTGDHIYSSVALGCDAEGRTDAVYLTSTDGRCYALDPNGRLQWSFDAGSPIRSSPVVGRGSTSDIVYFGSGDGRLYALNADDGTERWSYDTTPDDLESRDRNDLNGSPALGKTGILIGGEHGRLVYVPYDYPLQVSEPRGRVGSRVERFDDVCRLDYVTPGGNPQPGQVPTLPPATIITLRLIVREAARTVDARLSNPPFDRKARSLRIRFDPPIPFASEVSGDGRYLHLVPDGLLAPETTYRIHIEGNLYEGGFHIGNLTWGGRRTGRLEDTIEFRTAGFGATDPPFENTEETVSALEWTRLALPIPTMLPSLNQIGFDYLDWIIGTVETTPPVGDEPGKVILWAIGAKRDEAGHLVADPESDFMLPLAGSCQGDTFLVANRNVTIKVTGIPIPLNLLQLRGQLDHDLRVKPGATVYADARIRSIPTFGPLMVLAGLATNGWEKLVAVGTFVTRPFTDGAANRRPAGISVDRVHFEAPSRRHPGKVMVVLESEQGPSRSLAGRRLGLLLVDSVTRDPVDLDYHAGVRASTKIGSNAATISLNIPAGTQLPSQTEAIVMVDVFPLSRHRLGG
jgi:hypothetical protein